MKISRLMAEISYELSTLPAGVVVDYPLADVIEESARQIERELRRNKKAAISSFLDFVKDEEFANKITNGLRRKIAVLELELRACRRAA